MAETRQFFLITPPAGGGFVLSKDHGKLRLSQGRAGKPKRFTAWDCFDGPVRASGRLLLERGGKLWLLGQGGILQQPGKRSGNFAADLREGPVKAALAGLSPVRCLLPVAEGGLIRSSCRVSWRQKPCGKLLCWSFSGPAGRAVLIGLPAKTGRAGQAIANRLARLGAVPASPGDTYARLAPHRTVCSLKPQVPLAPDQPAAAAAAALIRGCLGAARQNEPGIVSDLDTEFLHGYRIALGRIRSLLSLCKGVYTAEDTRRLKRVFSGRMAATARLRRLDTCLLERPRLYAQVPQALHPGLDALFAAAASERQHCHRQLALDLAGARCKWQSAALRAEFAEGAAPAAGPRGQLPVLALAQELIWKRYGRVCRNAAGITPATPEAEVHRLRARCRKLRHPLELFAPLFPQARLNPALKPLTKLQNSLGIFHDCSAWQRVLLDFASGPAATREIALGAGALAAVLHGRQRAARAQIEAKSAAFSSPGTRCRFQALSCG